MLRLTARPICSLLMVQRLHASEWIRSSRTYGKVRSVANSEASWDERAIVSYLLLVATCAVFVIGSMQWPDMSEEEVQAQERSMRKVRSGSLVGPVRARHLLKLYFQSDESRGLLPTFNQHLVLPYNTRSYLQSLLPPPCRLFLLQRAVLPAIPRPSRLLLEFWVLVCNCYTCSSSTTSRAL